MLDSQYHARLFIGCIFGIVAGVFPLVIGIKRGRYIVAVLAFMACVAGGALLGRLLAFPLAFVTSAGIANLRDLRRPRRKLDPWDRPGY